MQDDIYRCACNVRSGFHQQGKCVRSSKVFVIRSKETNWSGGRLLDIEDRFMWVCESCILSSDYCFAAEQAAIR